MTIEFTRAELLEYQLKHGVGIYDARRALMRERMYAAVNSAQSIDDLKPVLIELINRY